MSRHTRGNPLPEDIRVSVRRLIDEHGESGASKALGIERRTVTRVIAGLTVYPGTAALVRLRLAELNRETA